MSGARFALAMVVTGLSLVAGGCRDQPRSSTSVSVVDHADDVDVFPKSHDVPPGRAAEVRRLFDGGVMSYPISVVSSAGAQTQFVQPRPVFIGENRFVVGAPAHTHDAIDRTLKAMAATAPPATAAASAFGTFELTYWAIEASVASAPEVSPDLHEIGPMLTKLDGLGPRKFVMLDRISGRARDGANSDLTGRLSKIHQKLIVGPDGIDLEIELEIDRRLVDPKDRPLSIETTLQLPLDRAVVFGDAALGGASSGSANLMLYVVRARRVD